MRPGHGPLGAGLAHAPESVPLNRAGTFPHIGVLDDLPADVHGFFLAVLVQVKGRRRGSRALIHCWSAVVNSSSEQNTPRFRHRPGSASGRQTRALHGLPGRRPAVLLVRTRSER